MVTDTGRLLILADDFTGACDAAAAFAAARSTLVLLTAPATWPADGGDAADVEVLGIDLDLRERSNVTAEPPTRDAARPLCATDADLRVFLKIDSTLRGPIAGLVAGALDGSARQVAVIAPAFPEQGRLLREGRVVVEGQPGASLTDALGMDRTALLGASFARSAEEVELAVEHARMRGTRHVVVDADRVECLSSVAAAWQRRPDWLIVGSAGLARQIAASSESKTQDRSNSRTARRGADAGGQTAPQPASLRRWPGSRAPAVDRPSPALSPSVLVISGSPAPATQLQIRQLRDLGPVVLIDLHAPSPSLPSGDQEVLVVCTPPAAERDAGERARAVAIAVATWARVFRPAAVVLAGGATARLVCEQLGAYGVHLQGELQPGIPFGYLVGGLWDRMRVVTKAGGFGTRDTLLDVVQSLGVSSIAERTHDC